MISKSNSMNVPSFKFFCGRLMSGKAPLDRNADDTSTRGWLDSVYPLAISSTIVRFERWRGILTVLIIVVESTSSVFVFACIRLSMYGK